jgi:hypothetical protein
MAAAAVVISQFVLIVRDLSVWLLSGRFLPLSRVRNGHRETRGRRASFRRSGVVRST